ncbi:maleylpyruvate isomerase family mycothiol-dependent enzyme [Asanoa sp. NPDC049518]|uniref:maleylpyruvate isomerase family mycothiol-dependent enzyme n=1 Tax=unclassified Asanoa TaxID=2685164 RepID=UPI00343BC8D4
MADALWPAVHAERGALAEDLAGLDDKQWAHPTLCGQWVVEEVVAHLTAAASITMARWLVSIVGARFNADVHNQRRMAEHRGATPEETLARFRRIVTSTTAPTRDTAAWLGEVVVHGEDIRRPLGLSYSPPVATVTEVARFYAGRDFTVAGRTMSKGLRLEATDGPFATGTGPVVSGTTLALTMVMAGRPVYGQELTGPGAPTMRERCSGGR